MSGILPAHAEGVNSLRRCLRPRSTGINAMIAAAAATTPATEPTTSQANTSTV
jgi:hypothetical protein